MSVVEVEYEEGRMYGGETVGLGLGLGFSSSGCLSPCFSCSVFVSSDSFFSSRLSDDDSKGGSKGNSEGDSDDDSEGDC